MPIDLSCPNCGKVLRTADDKAGRSARCPVCGAIITVPPAEAALPIFDVEEISPRSNPSPVSSSIGNSQPSSPWTPLWAIAATWIVGGLAVNFGVWISVIGTLAILGWLLPTGHFKMAGVCGWILGAVMLMQNAFLLAACLAVVLFLLLLSTRAAGMAWAFAALFGLTFLGAWQDDGDSPEPQGQVRQPQEQLRKLTTMQKAHKNLNELEGRRDAIQALLDKTREDQEDVVLRMRQMGIETTSDLKDHARGRVLVEEFQRLLAEVKGLENAIVRIEGGMAKAKALIRQVERNKVLGEAGLTEDELKKLSEQLLLAEETEVGELPNVPVDPVQTDALLEQALARP